MPQHNNQSEIRARIISPQLNFGAEEIIPLRPNPNG